MDVRHLAIAASMTLAAAGCSNPSDDNVAAPIDDAGTGEPDASGDAANADASLDVAPDVPAEPGSLVIEPVQLTFEDVRQGESRTGVIAVSNVGGRPLVVSNVTLTEYNRTGEPEFLQGEDWDDSFVVGGGLFREIEVVYEPKDFGIDQGEVEIFTNDPDNEIVTVRLETVSSYADLEGPQFVRFGEVEVGDDAMQRIILFNRGLDPLTIEDVALGGISEAFALSFEPQATPPNVVLQKDQDFVIDVRYSPLNADTDRGTITITSDDPDQDTFEIALTGNDPIPCLDINPDTVDFADAQPGQEQSQEMILLNCSRTLDLQITDIELTDDGGGVFGVGDLPEVPLELAPLDTTTFTVTGSLADPGVTTGDVTISSDDTKSSGVLPLRLKAVEQP